MSTNGSAKPAKTGAAARQLLCSRCYRRESCVQCCDTRFCLRHFHTTNHSSDHPQKAIVTNQRAFDEQLPAFEKMWKEVFQSVADDVERLSREVEEKVADDPLASIGMGLAPAPKGKDPRKAEGETSLPSKRRRNREQEGGAASASGSARDPFARRRTRPKNYWSLGNELESASEDGESTTEKRAAAIAAAPPRMGEYQCTSCESENTTFDIIGGAAVGSRKAETFGNKDAPELILRVLCHACGNNWLEER